MTIGSFSLLTGLSIATLRHYDEIGLLRPAEVDTQTGYRRYASGQIDVGRRVRLLRAADLSTQQIARILDGDDGDVREYWPSIAPRWTNELRRSTHCWINSYKPTIKRDRYQ